MAGGEGVTLGNLGIISDISGRYERAIDYYRQSLQIKREINDRRGETNTLQAPYYWAAFVLQGEWK